MQEVSIPYHELDQRHFTKNLYALAGEDHEFSSILEHQRINRKVRILRAGNHFINGAYYVNRNYERLYYRSAAQEVPRLYQEYLGKEEPVLLLSGGFGYGIKYLLNESKIEKLYLYERDPSLLKIALTLHDFAADILTGRLTIIAPWHIRRILSLDAKSIIPHPVLFSENKLEYLTISRWLATREPAAKKAVIFSGQLFVLDAATTLFDMGWDIFEIDPTIMTATELSHILDYLQPDLIFNINLFKDIKYLSPKWKVIEWEIDPTISPIETIEPEHAGNLHIFTHNADRVETFVARGHKHADYLPLCCSKKFLIGPSKSEQLARFACDVSFVGSIMAQNQRDLLDLLSRRLQSAVARGASEWRFVLAWVESFAETPPPPARHLEPADSLRKLLREQNLPNVLDMDNDRLLITSVIEEYLAYQWRRHVIAELLDMGMDIWGDPDWQNEFPGHYRGAADHYLDLPHLYRASRVNLDICRTYQPDIVTMRVFDVLACGAFILADRSEALLELFVEDKEIVCFETPDEARDKIRFYLTHENERQRIMQAGHRKAIRLHTFERRMSHILDRAGCNGNSRHP
jgi:glycosyltransferase involved in cell wall biosynthesis